MGECNPTPFLAGFPSVSFISFPPAPERRPRRSRKQLGPALPGTILCPNKALEGAGRKEHNGPRPDEGSVQEGTPPSFPPLPCLGTFSRHPFPLDAGHARGGGCEPPASHFPVLQVLQDPTLGAQVSSPASGLPREMLFHKLILQEAPWERLRSKWWQCPVCGVAVPYRWHCPLCATLP